MSRHVRRSTGGPSCAKSSKTSRRTDRALSTASRGAHAHAWAQQPTRRLRLNANRRGSSPTSQRRLRSPSSTPCLRSPASSNQACRRPAPRQTRQSGPHRLSQLSLHGSCTPPSCLRGRRPRCRAACKLSSTAQCSRLFPLHSLHLCRCDLHPARRRRLRRVHRHHSSDRPRRSSRRQRPRCLRPLWAWRARACLRRCRRSGARRRVACARCASVPVHA